MKVFLLDMSYEDNTSGVNRYLNVLIESLLQIESISICRLSFIRGEKNLFIHEECTNSANFRYFKIPLPVSLKEILIHPYWMIKYSEQVYRQINFLFSKNERVILHIHTINLIDFALFLKDRIPCFILTHLHCIPWKHFYNMDRKRFNIIYDEIVRKGKKEYQVKNIVGLSSELSAYENSDHIICVTNCAKKFLLGLMPRKSDADISVISNGLPDGQKRIRNKKYDKFTFLYVGVLSESKGVVFILKAMRILKRKGINPKLIVAGQYIKERRDQILEEYADLDIELKGLLSFSELENEYLTCDAGIISSLQEQCSYAAIEMMKYRLPIITTDVDGLHEMFDDRINALKVPVEFSMTKGLEVNTLKMALCMQELIEDDNLRDRLSRGAYLKFKQFFLVNKMVENTLNVYESLMGQKI